MSRHTVAYDWAIETLDPETGDITDVEHVNTYPGPKEGCDVCLVRDKGNEADGLVERQWAYIRPVFALRLPGDRYELPERFDIAGSPGVPVPIKFHREVRLWHKEHK